MKVQKFIHIIMVTGMAIQLTACNGGSDKDLTSIDSVNVNASHINLQLDEDVKIDADITVADQYKDGLSSYYIEDYIDGTEDYDVKNFQKNPILFGKSVSSQIELMESYNIGPFNMSTLSLSWQDMPYVGINDQDGKEFKGAWIYSNENLNSLELYYNLDDEWTEYNRLNRQTMDISDYYAENLPDDVKKEGDQLKEFLQIFTGRDISEKYFCCPIEELGKDNYIYYYFYSIDGFPWVTEELNLEYEKGTSLSEEVQERAEDGIVLNKYERPLIIYFADSKVQGMEICSFDTLTDYYQNQKEVVNVQEILWQLNTYFESRLFTESITITNIQLVYNAAITDGDDGNEIRHIVKPFWYVGYYTETEGNMCIIFDAYTGKFVSSQNFLRN